MRGQVDASKTPQGTTIALALVGMKSRRFTKARKLNNQVSAQLQFFWHVTAFMNVLLGSHVASSYFSASVSFPPASPRYFGSTGLGPRVPSALLLCCSTLRLFVLLAAFPNSLSVVCTFERMCTFSWLVCHGFFKSIMRAPRPRTSFHEFWKVLQQKEFAI